MQDLEDVQTQINNQRQKKKSLAQECVIVANGFILEAEQQKFSQTKHLKQASHYFLKALELDLKNLEAYLGLIFIASLVNQYEKAQQLLLQAQAIAPDDPRIKTLEQEFKKLQAIGTGMQPVTREALLAKIRQKREEAKRNTDPLPELTHVHSLRAQLEGTSRHEDDEDDEYDEDENDDDNDEDVLESDFDPNAFTIFDFEAED